MSGLAQIGQATLYCGDCREAIKTLEAGSIDSVVCDPPYELGFMGKSWDASGIAYDVSLWREALRVLKPGGHLLAFGGSRTYHRLACAIEDAGFEIRDQIMWLYGQGFPKSHNLDKALCDIACQCDGSALPYGHEETAKQTTEHDLRPLHESDVSPQINTGAECGKVLQPSLSEQGLCPAMQRQELEESGEGREERGLEGRDHASSPEGQLRSSALCPGPGMGEAHGSQGRLCDGASFSHGEADRTDAIACGDGTSHRSQAAEQLGLESGAVAGQPEPQAGGAWTICGECGKPRILAGLGTALKPAHEPIVVARKPLIGTVAETVLKHGTGALNIDGCRVPTEDNLNGGAYSESGRIATLPGDSREGAALGMFQAGSKADSEYIQPGGRWPANVIHDGSDEVLAGFPQTKSGSIEPHHERTVKTTDVIYGKFAEPSTVSYGDKGAAARFFYCAKASKADRDHGLDGFEDRDAGIKNESGRGFSEGDPYKAVRRKNHHPTVKPTALMRYLCRLVTPPGGTVLDPFMGSGSTGKAALLEGFRFVGIEREQEYFEIAKARVAPSHKQPEMILSMTEKRPEHEQERQPDLFSFTAA